MGVCDQDEKIVSYEREMYCYGRSYVKIKYISCRTGTYTLTGPLSIRYTIMSVYTTYVHV